MLLLAFLMLMYFSVIAGAMILTCRKTYTPPQRCSKRTRKYEASHVRL